MEQNVCHTVEVVYDYVLPRQAKVLGTTKRAKPFIRPAREEEDQAFAGVWMKIISFIIGFDGEERGWLKTMEALLPLISAPVIVIQEGDYLQVLLKSDRFREIKEDPVGYTFFETIGCPDGSSAIPLTNRIFEVVGEEMRRELVSTPFA